MTRRKGMMLIVAAAVAVLLNIGLFGTAALLSRDRPVREVASNPISVNLVTIKPPTPPQEEKKREIPKPKPKPQMDFMPELALPTPRGPSPMDVQVDIDPSLLPEVPSAGSSSSTAATWTSRPRKWSRRSRSTPTRRGSGTSRGT